MTGNARIGAEMTAPGLIVHRTGGVIEFGELKGGETERARNLAEVFKRAGILGQLMPGIWQAAMGQAAVERGLQSGDRAFAQQCRPRCSTIPTGSR